MQIPSNILLLGLAALTFVAATEHERPHGTIPNPVKWDPNNRHQNSDHQNGHHWNGQHQNDHNQNEHRPKKHRPDKHYPIPPTQNCTFPTNNSTSNSTSPSGFVTSIKLPTPTTSAGASSTSESAEMTAYAEVKPEV